MTDLERTEKGCLEQFAQTRDPTHLLVLADALREDGAPARLWEEEVCRAVASDAGLHDATAWFMRSWPRMPITPATLLAGGATESGPAFCLRWSAKHAFTERWMGANHRNFQLFWTGYPAESGEWIVEYRGWGNNPIRELLRSRTAHLSGPPVREDYYHLSYYPLGEPREMGSFGSGVKAYDRYFGEQYPPEQRWAEVAVVETNDANRVPGNVGVPRIPYPPWLTEPDKRPRPGPPPVCLFRKERWGGTLVALFPTELPSAEYEHRSPSVCRSFTLARDGSTVVDSSRYYHNCLRSSDRISPDTGAYERLKAAMIAANVTHRVVQKAPPKSYTLRRDKILAKMNTDPQPAPTLLHGPWPEVESDATS